MPYHDRVVAVSELVVAGSVDAGELVDAGEFVDVELEDVG